MATHEQYDVVIVGGGVAGLTAGIFTGRADLDTLIVNRDESILSRSSHLENFPGFPVGVDARLFLDMVRDQTREAGCEVREGEVTRLRRADGEFELSLGEGTVGATYVVAASWADSSYLDGLDVSFVQRGSKQFIDVGPQGRTDVEGLYAAGRLAEKHHQTVVSAGHGAQVALTLLADSDVPFYHDWVAPEGYFTGRDREIPPGCEEIDEEERERRERRSMDVMREYFAERHPEEPTMHPSVEETD